MAVDYAALKKGGFMRQKQKNNFSLRLQVVGGNLTAENLKKIAEVAEKYGDGHVHLTSRQSVEIPFVKLDDVEEVKEELAKGGCKPGVCGPRVRTVTACQGNQICPSGNIDTYDIAKKLDARYYARELPHKFKFGVTGCQNNCLKAEENDVGIKGAMVVNGSDGLDEITMTGKTHVCEVKDGKISTYDIDPHDYGFEYCTADVLKGGTPEENAKMTLDILTGKDKGARRNTVLLNAGCAIYCAGKAATIADGVKLAAEMIDSGKAYDKLNEMKDFTNS